METEMIRAAGAQPGGEWRFSVLDRACLNMVIKGMWLFHGRLDAAAMKESFARLLGYYPHLCGRVMRGEAVACDNSGVPFAVDEAPRCRLEQAVLMPGCSETFRGTFRPVGFQTGKAGAVEREAYTAGRRYRAEPPWCAWLHGRRCVLYVGGELGQAAPRRTGGAARCGPILVAAARNPVCGGASSQCEGGRMVSCRVAAALPDRLGCRDGYRPAQVAAPAHRCR